MKKIVLISMLGSMPVFFACNKDNKSPELPKAENLRTLSDEVEIEMAEEGRIEMADGMVSFKNSLSAFYADGQTFEEFKISIFGNPDHQLTADANNLLLAAYHFLSNDGHVVDGILINDDFIRAGYNGIHMAKWVMFALNNDSNGSEFFGLSIAERNGSGPCNWYAVGCHVDKAWKWLKGTGKEVIAVGAGAIGLARTIWEIISPGKRP